MEVLIMKAIKKNLRDQTGTNDETIMYCPFCFDEFSANVGDYWDVPGNHVFKCSNCKKPVLLGRKRTIYEPLA
jgi:Zn-finger protein